MRALTVARRAVVAAALVVAAGALPAAAAPGATRAPARSSDRISVSNPTPTRNSEIDVFSRGWRPGGVVVIDLAGKELRRVAADARGSVETSVTIPAGIRGGFGTLAVTGSNAAGIPQQLVTGLSVVVDQPHGASRRPWPTIFLLLAAATLLLLVSQRVHAHAAPTPGPPSPA